MTLQEAIKTLAALEDSTRYYADLSNGKGSATPDQVRTIDELRAQIKLIQAGAVPANVPVMPPAAPALVLAVPAVAISSSPELERLRAVLKQVEIEALPENIPKGAFGIPNAGILAGRINTVDSVRSQIAAELARIAARTPEGIAADEKKAAVDRLNAELRALPRLRPPCTINKGIFGKRGISQGPYSVLFQDPLSPTDFIMTHENDHDCQPWLNDPPGSDPAACQFSHIRHPAPGEPYDPLGVREGLATYAIHWDGKNNTFLDPNMERTRQEIIRDRLEVIAAASRRLGTPEELIQQFLADPAKIRLGANGSMSLMPPPKDNVKDAVAVAKVVAPVVLAVAAPFILPAVLGAAAAAAATTAAAVAEKAREAKKTLDAAKDAVATRAEPAIAAVQQAQKDFQAAQDKLAEITSPAIGKVKEIFPGPQATGAAPIDARGAVSVPRKDFLSEFLDWIASSIADFVAWGTS